MTETKQEQIKRLQKNDIGFYALPKEDQEFMDSLVETGEDIVIRAPEGWVLRRAKYSLSTENTYRIHKDYQPEPDKLVFPGYVLCEVYQSESGSLWFKIKIGTQLIEMGLDLAPRLGCCGYIVKEDPDMIYESPIRWVREGGKSTYPACSIKTKMKPATLGWVVFLEGRMSNLCPYCNEPPMSDKKHVWCLTYGCQIWKKVFTIEEWDNLVIVKKESE